MTQLSIVQAPITDDERLLTDEIYNLIRQGRAKKAIKFFWERLEQGASIQSSHTFYALSLAICDCKNKKDDTLLATVSREAAKRLDYHETELDFLRGKAVRRAAVDCDFIGAKRDINEVIERRSDESWHDRLQLPKDYLARCKIEIIEGTSDGIAHAIEWLNKLKEWFRPDEQTMLDIDCWLCLGYLLLEENEHAYVLAAASLDSGDRKRQRHLVWLVATAPVPKVRPTLTRFIVRRTP